MKYNYTVGKHMKEFVVDSENFFEEEVSPIRTIYNAASAQIGLDYDNCPGTFSCGEILVAKDVCDKALDLMSEEYGKISANTIWLIYGPKMQEDLPDGTIAVSDKFYEKGEEN